MKPIRCPHCQFEQPAGHDDCLKCGIVFAKYHGKTHGRDSQSAPAGLEKETPESVIRSLLLPEPVNCNPFFFAGRAALLLALAAWSVKFIFTSIDANYAGRSFLHLVNLPFHEAGHIIFSPFGRLLHALGGTLGQLLMPLVCMIVLLIRTRDAFGAAVATWWLAESFMDIAPYINDARALNLILLGGVTGKEVEDYHDWEFILRKLNLLEMDHFLAWTAQGIGIVLMLAAMVWAFLNLRAQYRSLRQGN